MVIKKNSTCEGLAAPEHSYKKEAEKPPEPWLFLTLGLVSFPGTVTRAGTVTQWAGKP